MAQDDLVPDSALVSRLEMLTQAAQDAYDIMSVRPHLGPGRRTILDAKNILASGVAELKALAQPDDPINAKYRSRMRAECFPGFSGTWFYPFDPKPEEVRHADIVHALPHINRYGGHTSRPLSVVEHSIKVAAMAEHLITLEVREGRVSAEYIPVAALHGLLDDAQEAYVGDVIGPIRAVIMHVLGIPWSRIEDVIHAAILQAYYLAPPPPEVEAAIRLADKYALYNELIALRPGEDTADPRWHLAVPPPDVAAVGAIKREQPDIAKVRALFDSEVRRLVQILGGDIPGNVPWVDPSAIKKASPGLITDPLVSVPPMTKKLGQLSEPMPETLFTRGASPIDTPHAAPRPRGVSSWRNKVASSEMDIPPELMNEPEFKKDE